jgi:hypothetical protein
LKRPRLSQGRFAVPGPVGFPSGPSVEYVTAMIRCGLGDDRGPLRGDERGQDDDVVIAVVADRMEVAVTRVDEGITGIEKSWLAVFADVVRQDARSGIDQEPNTFVVVPRCNTTGLDGDAQHIQLGCPIHLYDVGLSSENLVPEIDADIVHERPVRQKLRVRKSVISLGRHTRCEQRSRCENACKRGGAAANFS